MSMKNIGFIGMGLMGQPMSKRLLAAGFSLTIWNRSAEKCSQLLAVGAELAATPRKLAETADVILLCVADTAAVEDVLLHEEGVLAGLGAGKIVVDFSSIDPDATRRLASRVRAVGAEWVDAPVSGGVTGAEAGTLVIMAGGNPDTVEKLQPVFSALSQRVTHMGDNGAGQVTKICNQLIVAANAVLIAEAVALAQKAGVDASKLAPALAGGFADSKPFQILAPRMSTGSFEPVQWRVQTLLKDLNMAVSQSQNLGLDSPLATHAAELLRQHGDNGFLEQDLSSVIRLFAKDEPVP